MIEVFGYHEEFSGPFREQIRQYDNPRKTMVTTIMHMQLNRWRVVVDGNRFFYCHTPISIDGQVMGDEVFGWEVSISDIRSIQLATANDYSKTWPFGWGYMHNDACKWYGITPDIGVDSPANFSFGFNPNAKFELFSVLYAFINDGSRKIISIRWTGQRQGWRDVEGELLANRHQVAAAIDDARFKRLRDRQGAIERARYL